RLNPEDIMIVDRGFRDAVNVMENLGFEVMMPEFLYGKKQFPAYQANSCVTKIRWAVESVNAMIKRWKFLSQTIQNSTIRYLEELFGKRIDRMDLRKPSKWKDINADQVDFPELSEDDIRELALGVFQVKQARSYVEEKKSSSDDYIFTVQSCSTAKGIISVKLQSRHISARIFLIRLI
ncbi:unnamed protein product, partial [Didymodactylos carnosus]